MNIKQSLTRSARSIVELLRSYKAKNYLRQQSTTHITKDSEIRIAFLAGEPETWDKSEPVFEALCQNSRFHVDLYIVPSYDDALQIPKEYGYEWEYFNEKYPEFCHTIFDKDEIIDLNASNYDYLFYGDPYMGHFPRQLRAYNLIKNNRICYIPYGFYGAKFGYDLMAENRSFFCNTYLVFCDCQDVKDILESLFPDTTANGLQRFVNLGYPTLEKFLRPEFRVCNYRNILWAPRWSYSEMGGGSHFMEYKDLIFNVKEISGNYHLILRPHPMTFANVVGSGLMSETEVQDYKQHIIDVGAELNQHTDINETIKRTDIFITDYSSLMIHYFMTGKPVIYCPSKDPFDKTYTKMLEGIYIAKSWDNIEQYLTDLSNGNDWLKEKRMEILKSDEFTIHAHATERIVDFLINDMESDH